MPINHIYKSLKNINEKTFFYMNFYLIVTQTKNKNIFFMSTLFIELISCHLCLSSLYLFWLTQVCILTKFLLYFFLCKHKYDHELVK